jgi:hypothetical protein
LKADNIHIKTALMKMTIKLMMKMTNIKESSAIVTRTTREKLEDNITTTCAVKNTLHKWRQRGTENIRSLKI